MTFLVVGGGVIGLSCALHVRATVPKMHVVIVDSPTNPGVASRAAAGMLAPYAEFEEDSPLFRLAIASLEYYPKFLRRFCNVVPLINNCGVLIPADGNLLSRARRIGEFASPHSSTQWLDANELRKIDPSLAISSALRVEGAIINPRELHDALQAAAVAASISTQSGIVQSFLRAEDGSIRGAELQNGEIINCDIALIASGAWSRDLGALAGMDLQMTPVKGQVLRVAAPDGFLHSIIHTHDVYIAPRVGEGLVIGATMEETGFNESLDANVTKKLLRAAEAFVPSIVDFPLVDAWIGFRPKLNGGNPEIAWARDVPNLLIATGHFRNGILLTPITGKIIAERLAEKLSP